LTDHALCISLNCSGSHLACLLNVDGLWTPPMTTSHLLLKQVKMVINF